MAAENDGWTSLFDGKTLKGWRVAAKPEDVAKNYWTVQDGVKTGAVPQFPNKPLNEVEHGRSGGIRGQFGSGYRVDRLPRLFVRTDDESRRGVVQPSRVMRWARWHGEALRS